MASTGMAPEAGTLPLPSRLFRASFLNAAVSAPLAGDAATRWPGHGLKFQPWPCRGAYVGDSGCSPTLLTDETPECEDFIEQLPFKMYDVLRFSAFSAVADNPEAFMMQRFDSLVSSLFAKELLDGAGSGGYSLSGEAHQAGGGAFSGSSHSVAIGLAAIEDDLAASLNGGQGLIHLPPGLLAGAIEGYAIEWTGTHYETPTGHIVVADAGYVNMPHPAATNAAGTNKTFIYGSGPVFYGYSAPDFVGDMTDGGSFNRSRNTFTRFVEGYGIVLFDPCAVTATLVDYHKP